jgi:predicted RNA polymerase sigma factor
VLPTELVQHAAVRTRPRRADPALTELRGRLLVSLAWAESERGGADTGFRLLNEAEPLLPAGQRPILLAQRALLLERTGRYDLALQQYDEAVALMSERSHPGLVDCGRRGP